MFRYIGLLKPARLFSWVCLFYPAKERALINCCFFRFSDIPDPPRLPDRATGASTLKLTYFMFFPSFLCFCPAKAWVLPRFFRFCDIPDPSHLNDRVTDALFVQTLWCYTIALLRCYVVRTVVHSIVAYTQQRSSTNFLLRCFLFSPGERTYIGSISIFRFNDIPDGQR